MLVNDIYVEVFREKVHFEICKERVTEQRTEEWLEWQIWQIGNKTKITKY